MWFECHLILKQSNNMGKVQYNNHKYKFPSIHLLKKAIPVIHTELLVAQKMSPLILS